MRDALGAVLRSRHALMVICISVGFLAASAPARAASGPVRASSMLVVAKKHTIAQPPPLELAAIERDIAAVVGVPVRISCDTVGVPSPLDGRTIEAGNDGQVFYRPDGSLGDVLHIWAQECSDARHANRHRDPNPPAYFAFLDRRIDTISAPAFLVLLHEAFHYAYQSSDEGRVECAAVSNAWPLVRTLGLPAWEASMMLYGMQWRHAMFTPEASPQYRTVC